MMLGKKITSSIIMFLLFGFSFSQVTLEIKNADEAAGTLEIYMTNPAGCSYCTDSTFDNKNGCESYGTAPDSTTPGTATWVFDTTIDAATCSGACSDGASDEDECNAQGTCSDTDYTSKAKCEAIGLCDSEAFLNQAACEGAAGTWTPKEAGTWTGTTWTNSAMNGNYFSGEVGGFQFELLGTKMANKCTIPEYTTKSTCENNDGYWSAASGGLVEDIGECNNSAYTTKSTCEGASAQWTKKYNADTIDGENTVLGFSFSGVLIDPGVSRLLTIVDYADDPADTSKGVCFGIDTGESGDNVVSDKHGGYINTIWGACSCDTGVADACGVCEGNNPTHCYATNSNDVCTLDNECEAGFCDCSGTCGGIAQKDNCNTCDETPANDCDKDCSSQEVDCNGTWVSGGEDEGCWGGTATVDCTGSCVALANIAADEDNDGYCDDVDDCLGSPLNTSVNAAGCTIEQLADLNISQLGNAIPGTFAIAQNFPNPFNPTTSIAFDVAYMDNISLVVYDLTGKEVVTLASGAYAPGSYNVEWNAIDNKGQGLVSGMYIYRYTTSEKAITRKMLYLK